MIYKKLILILLSFVLIAPLYSQPNRNKKYGYDATFWKVGQAKYEWGEKIKNKERSQGISKADQWFYKDSQPLPGFVELKDGTVLTGSFKKRHHWNKASEYSNVEGASEYDVPWIKEEGGEWRNFQLSDVEKYGIYYTMDDLNAGPFDIGELTLKNGLTVKGRVFTLYWKSPYAGLKYYGKILIEGDDLNVVSYQSDEIDEAVIGEEKWLNIDDWLVSPKNYRTAFTESAQSNGYLPMKPGNVSMRNGAIIKGSIAIEDQKKPSKAFFISEDDSYIHSLSYKNTGMIKFEDGSTYVPNSIYLVDIDFAMNKWSKSEDLQPGKIVFENGDELVGNISFDRDANVVKSYRFIDAVFFLPSDGSIGYLFDEEGGVDYFEHNLNGVVTKYVPVNGKFVDYKDFVQELSSNSSNEPTKNLQPGYVVMADGTKKEGKIAATKYKMSFIGNGNDLEQFKAYQMKINYYVQKIDGKERKFVPMPRRAKAFGSNYQYVEILEHDKKFSYYENPFPTNVRKGISNLGGAVINSAVSSATDDLSEEAARQAAKNEYDNSQDIAATAKAANQSYYATQQALEGVGASDEGGIFFEEYVLIDNSNGQKYVIFKKNDKQELEALLSSCASYQQMTESEKKKTARFEDIERAVSILNNCKN
ncbi:hypothetical protein [Fulvivirga lutea]|uniref:Uncharacterized protein n=1 Tax=Fulvivirga lutea TaxID=2810512 RepID=A0A974WGX9_9BACT|nr:hypothetical protein [Fulvivirga lutea]QSE96917.1 hypothetical protein JR347_15150 [Fulvivirga lutea]